MKELTANDVPCALLPKRLPPLILIAIAVMAASFGLRAGPLISNINTDKAMYVPGATVTIWVDLANGTGSNFNGTVDMSISHLGSISANLGTKSIANLAAGATTTKTYSWTPPMKDYQGYLVAVTVRSSGGAVVDNGSSAIDVSSDWAKFPRYGFVANFPLGLDAYNVMWQLKNHHINGIQFYDWQWKHHVPYNSGSSWPDIANRTIYRATLTTLLSAAHSYSMMAMNYNLYGGAYDTYPVDASGVQLSMGIFGAPRPASGYSITNQLNHLLSSSWATTRLYEMNNRDPAWQTYIFGREQEVFTNFVFDGWHIDSLGMHNAYDYNGSWFSLDDSNPQFINNAKTTLNKRMLFNTVDAGGENQIAQSANVDFIYSELWNNNANYFDLARRVDNVRKYGSKPIVFAAYLNRGLSSGNFNEASVRLADAAIFACGAAHLELGDGNRMLHNEYFPDTGSVLMSTSLRAAMRTYYDFLVGYENLLRDQVVSAAYPVTITGVPVSTTGNAGTVWSISKKTLGYNIVHFINLLNNTSTQWRDNAGTYALPPAVTNLAVKMYHAGPPADGKLWYATPDTNCGAAFQLGYTRGSDAGGNYVTFVVPQLQYWDMVWLEINRTNNAAGPMQATDYDTMAAISTEPTTDAGGGFNVCCVNNTNGDAFVGFNNVDFSAGYSNVTARVAAALPGGTLEFHLDAPNGPLIATVAVGDTGGWQNWHTVHAPLTGASGVRKLFVVFRNAPSNLNWFKFSLLPYARPSLSFLSATNGQFRLEVSGESGPDYTILGSADLMHWTPVYTNSSPTLPFTWSDENPAGPWRFYRVMVGP